MKYLQRFLKDIRAVSPVIGVILMVAITVVMAAVIAAWVYGHGMPKTVPTMAATLADDPKVSLNNSGSAGPFSQRAATLTILTCPNIAPTDLRCVVTYTDVASGAALTEYTMSLDGVYWVPYIATDATTVKSMSPTGIVGTNIGATRFTWVDSDGSLDVSPGDRFDFTEMGANVTGQEVRGNTNFTVKLIHKPSESVLVDQTITVY